MTQAFQYPRLPIPCWTEQFWSRETVERNGGIIKANTTISNLSVLVTGASTQGINYAGRNLSKEFVKYGGTINFKIYGSSTSSYFGAALSFACFNKWGFIVNFHQGLIKVMLRYLSSGYYYKSIAATENVWHKVSIVWDGTSTLKLFVDGVEATGTEYINPNYDYQDVFVIGGDFSEGMSGLNGRVSDVTILPRVQFTLQDHNRWFSNSIMRFMDEAEIFLVCDNAYKRASDNKWVTRARTGQEYVLGDGTTANTMPTLMRNTQGSFFRFNPSNLDRIDLGVYPNMGYAGEETYVFDILRIKNANFCTILRHKDATYPYFRITGNENVTQGRGLWYKSASEWDGVLFTPPPQYRHGQGGLLIVLRPVNGEADKAYWNKTLIGAGSTTRWDASSPTNTIHLGYHQDYKDMDIAWFGYWSRALTDMERTLLNGIKRNFNR